MSTARRFISMGLMLGLAACSAPSGPETAGEEAELRELRPDEIAGFMQYGDAVSVPYTRTPTYRAYRFRANAFDVLDIKVTSSEPGTAAWAALLGADGEELLQKSADADGAARIRYKTPHRFEQLTVVVREASTKPSTLSIELSSTGVRQTATEVTPTPGTYAPPAALAGKNVDVTMRCLSRSYYTDGNSTEEPAGGVLSLGFGANGPEIRGADDALRGVQDATLKLASEPGQVKPPSYGNTIALAGATGSTGSYRHLVQLTNDAPDQIRVEYALESIGGNTGKPARHLSCVGVAKP